MVQALTFLTAEPDSVRAASQIAQATREAFHGAAPQALVLFASARHDHRRLLQTLRDELGADTLVVGASSAGEFTHGERAEGGLSALALRGPDIEFAVGVGRDVSSSPQAAARAVAESFRGSAAPSQPYRAALVITDALAGFADEVVQALTVATGGGHSFFGGGAGDDGRFEKTHVFAGTEVLDNAVVALEIRSARPIGIGVAHGWEPAGTRLRVTQTEGARIVSLNGAPAVEAFVAHAQATGQRFDRADPLPFFLHNILGIEEPGGHRLRVPLGVADDGSVLCAAEVPRGAVVQVMRTSEASAVRAAQQATRQALAALGGHPPAAALVFDCVATRLRLGRGFENELKACAELLHPARFAGCNTYGQIARAEGQFGGFHNCTAVVCVLPQSGP